MLFAPIDRLYPRFHSIPSVPTGDAGLCPSAIVPDAYRVVMLLGGFSVEPVLTYTSSATTIARVAGACM